MRRYSIGDVVYAVVYYNADKLVEVIKSEVKDVLSIDSREDAFYELSNGVYVHDERVYDYKAEAIQSLNLYMLSVIEYNLAYEDLTGCNAVSL